MTNIEKEFSDFRDKADSVYPEIDDVLRLALDEISDIDYSVKYDFVDDTVRIEFHGVDGSFYASYYENVHLLMYALGGAMIVISHESNMAFLYSLLLQKTLPEVIVELINSNIEAVNNDEDDWEKTCI